jgi:voltage-gated potassium channel Kch
VLEEGVDVARPRLIERRVTRFLRDPVSVRTAAGVIAVSTTVVVVASGVLMRLLDSSEYPTVGRGLWWAMQTVTTVGYGDVTPQHTSGRIVAVVVMLWGIALVSILVAAVTSTFVARAVRERGRADADDDGAADRDQARYDDLVARLERIERKLPRPGKS